MNGPPSSSRRPDAHRTASQSTLRATHGCLLAIRAAESHRCAALLQQSYRWSRAAIFLAAAPGIGTALSFATTQMASPSGFAYLLRNGGLEATAFAFLAQIGSMLRGSIDGRSYKIKSSMQPSARARSSLSSACRLGTRPQAQRAQGGPSDRADAFRRSTLPKQRCRRLVCGKGAARMRLLA